VRTGYYSGRLRKISGERLPSEGESGERDIFQEDGERVRESERCFQEKSFPVKGRGENGIFFRECEREREQRRWSGTDDLKWWEV
jgi:hypothetical protein